MPQSEPSSLSLYKMDCKTLRQSTQGCVNIPLIQGDAQDFRFHFQPPFNLADYRITMDVKRQNNVNFRPVFRKTVGDGITIDGQVMIIGFGKEFFADNAETYHYDIAFERISDGTILHLIEGRITIKLSTTKP